MSYIFGLDNLAQTYHPWMSTLKAASIIYILSIYKFCRLAFFQQVAKPRSDIFSSKQQSHYFCLTDSRHMCRFLLFVQVQE